MDLTEEQDQEGAEYLRCYADPIYFLDTYGWIKDPASSQVIQFKLWEHQKELIRLWEEHPQTILVKSKQIGVSWAGSGYGLWKAVFHPATNVLMMSKGEDEAKELLAKAKFIWEHLPRFLKLPLDIDQTELMTFPAMDSEIKSLPATRTAGVGKTATVVIQDEWDFHPYPEENYGNLKATVGDGAQFIGLSTVDKMRAVSFFRKMYIQAKDGQNNFYPIFLSWSVRPDRDPDWYEKQLKDFEPWLMEQNYPNTEEEALSPPQALAAFSQQALKAMENWCRPPICSVTDADLAYIYQKYVVGRRYAAFSDTSHGVGKDKAVTTVMDLQNGIVVADIMSNLIPPEELARQSVQVLREYHSPLWAIEDNDWGIATIQAAQALGYTNFYFKDEKKREANVPGWTTNKRNVWTLWAELIEAANAGLITVLNKEGLAQFFQVIRNPDKHGKIEAQEGANDDYPFAVGGCWQMRKEVKGTGTGRAVSLLHPATSSY